MKKTSSPRHAQRGTVMVESLVIIVMLTTALIAAWFIDDARRQQRVVFARLRRSRTVGRELPRRLHVAGGLQRAHIRRTWARRHPGMGPFQHSRRRFPMSTGRRHMSILRIFNPWRIRTKRSEVWGGLMRVVAYCLCVSLAFTALTLFTVLAEARESALR